MKNIEVKFPASDKIFHVFSNDKEYEFGDLVLVDNGQIAEVASIVKIDDLSSENQDKTDENNLKIVKILDERDKEKIKLLKRKAKEFLPKCNEKISKYDLTTMKLLDAELSFDEKKLTFYFSSSGRVDFRDLVSDLVKSFRKIIRLQQIGSRDEAKLLGGAGRCGRGLCCSSFLSEIDSVSLDMAKDQDIVFGANKLSGACGKLMCCLAFELEEYKKAAMNLPSVGDSVKYKKDSVKVISRNLLKQTYTIETPDGQRIEVEK
jgi:cell fate regulator YaaT (PSP1 superfamily)